MSFYQELLSFENEITKFKTLEALIEDVLYRNPKLSASEIAGALDYSPSELSRMIHPNSYSADNKRYFPLVKLIELLELTEDYRILHWLNFKYLVPDAEKKRYRLEKLEKYLPVIETVLKEIKGLKRTRE